MGRGKEDKRRLRVETGRLLQVMLGGELKLLGLKSRTDLSNPSLLSQP